MLVTREDPVRNRAATGCGLCEYVDCFIVVTQHMMQLKAVELALPISYDLTLRLHLRVDVDLVLHDLIHDHLRVAPDLKMLDSELDSDSETVDQGLVLGGVVLCRKV
jgi:hypothetical protein